MDTPLKDILNTEKTIYEISSESTLLEAAEKMAKYKVGSLLVMDHHQPQGIITERDFLFKVSAHNKNLQTTKVSEIMSKGLIRLHSEQKAKDALKVMTEKRIRHLPIYNEKEEFLGLLSIGDLAKWATSRYHEKISEVEDLVNYIQQ